MSENKKENIRGTLVLLTALFFGLLLIFGGKALLERYQTQVVPVAATMDEDNLAFQASARVTDLYDTQGKPFEAEEGKLYEMTIRYYINGDLANPAVYGCSDMETVTTFLARKPRIEADLKTAFNLSRITDQAGNPFNRETMTLSPYITVEALN